MKRLSLLLVFAVSAAQLATACGGGKQPPAPPPSPNADSIARARQDSIRRAQEAEERRRREEEERMARDRDAAERARITEEVRNTLANMIHFDFDKSNIRPDDAAILDTKVAILRANPDVRVRISGHCDERGSDEYNLALGNRRATSTKQYLVSHGIDASRIETLSYGEERPIAMGHDESAWWQNRRSEFEIIAGGDVLVQP